MSKFRSKVPSRLPAFELLVDDVASASNDDLQNLAKHLGVSVSQLGQWVATNDAPRAHTLAVFWETKWGRSIQQVEGQNEVDLWRDLVREQTREIEALRRKLERLEGLSSLGSANGPLFRLTPIASPALIAKQRGQF
jgi:hypothetical protein